MAKWDKPMYDGGWGTPGENDCYINDLMELAKQTPLVFQRTDGGVELIKYEGYREGFIDLGDDSLAEDEGKNVFWNDGEKLKGPRIYFWDLDPTEKILIWWDHDIGDVVIDNLSGDDDTSGWGMEKLTDDLYFYWIT